MAEKIILQNINSHVLTILKKHLIKINLKYMILTLLKMQNKALMFSEMRVIYKKEAVSSNDKINNWHFSRTESSGETQHVEKIQKHQHKYMKGVQH